MTLTNVNENTVITLAMWNNALQSTNFSPLRADAYGVLNPYVVTNKITIMNNITSFATRFIANKDIRSNYMTFNVNSGSIVTNTWTQLNSGVCTSVIPFNSYYTNLTGDSGTNQYGRLKTNFDLTNGIITVNTRSLYLIYANLKFINPASSIPTLAIRIVDLGSTQSVASILVDRETNSIVSGRTVYAQAQFLTKTYASRSFNVEFYTSNATSAIVEFGYTELISTNKDSCGEI